MSLAKQRNRLVAVLIGVIAMAIPYPLAAQDGSVTIKTNGYHIILTPKPQSPQVPQPRRNFTVSGKVTDAATGEVIIGCMMFDRASK